MNELEFALLIARTGGHIIRTGRDMPLNVSVKDNRTRVSDVDRRINALVIEGVRKYFPGHAVMGEEESFGDVSGTDVWIVDPLDGTDRYLDGEDGGTFGIAKRSSGRIELGAVNNPFTGELFWAARGMGAYLNGQRIHVGTQTMKRGTQYDYCAWPNCSPDARAFDELLGPPLDDNSVLYKACKVAQGLSAFVVFPGRNVHDVAPASIIVEEAGGSVTDAFGDPLIYDRFVRGAVFSNGVIHDAVLSNLHS